MACSIVASITDGFEGYARRSRSQRCQPSSGAMLQRRDLVVAFAAAAVDLQEKRHFADYDVMIRMNRSDAVLAISTAPAALARFNGAGQVDKLAFLSLLLFQPRG